MDIEEHAELVSKIVDGMSKTFRRDIVKIIEDHGTSVAASVATNVGIQMCGIGVCTVPEHARDVVMQLIHESLENNMHHFCSQIDADIAIKRAKEMSQ